MATRPGPRDLQRAAKWQQRPQILAVAPHKLILEDGVDIHGELSSQEEHGDDISSGFSPNRKSTPTSTTKYRRMARRTSYVFGVNKSYRQCSNGREYNNTITHLYIQVLTP
jgi:hypothetical protein